VLDLPAALVAATLSAGVLGSTLIALAVGFLATWRLLGRTPLAVLREE
jgi:ABC-type antimicrobial peptide transport system permease subunit